MTHFANRFILLIFFFLFSAADAHEQMILVVAETMDAPTALLQRYDKEHGIWKQTGKAFRVNIGRNGLGWGIGLQNIPHAQTDPVKHEGDGKAPAGVFALGPAFGYSVKALGSLPYLHASKDLICVDDADSGAYNKIVPIRPDITVRSFEWMRRKDRLYRYGIVVEHNPDAIPGRGSCVFIHIQRGEESPTAGCTSMPETRVKSLLRWLKPERSPILVQIPRKSLQNVKKNFAIP